MKILLRKARKWQKNMRLTRSDKLLTEREN